MEKKQIIATEEERGGKIPNQKELEKELSEYLSKKYGNRVRVISPFVFPKGKPEGEKGPMGGRQGDQLPAFDMLPEELEAYLDNFVVKQKEAKAILATKICTHFNRVKATKRGKKDDPSKVGMIKNNVLMIGPTGVGKTYMIKLIAQKLGVPFVKGDATKFSETGYVGGDVEDLVRDLVHEANEDIELAEHGIIYIDEIDKIASAHNFIGHDVSRTGVQRALLKPMEETEVDLKVPHDPISQIQAIEHYRRTGKRERKVVNTKNILFIMSGAFSDLAEIIKKRLQKQGIGFEADVSSREVQWDILKEVRPQDLIEFGFESEFVGRLPVIVVFDELTKDDLVEILKNPNNPIILSKRLDFKAYGIEIKFEEKALEVIAERAAHERTGARGLVSAIERVLIPFEKKLPSTEIKRFLVTQEVVEDPQKELEKLLQAPEDSGLEERFEAARKAEIKNIRRYIKERLDYYEGKAGVSLSERRMDIISTLHLRNVTDLTSALEEFKDLYDQVKVEEAALHDKVDVKITFDEGAVDAIIEEAIATGQDAGSLAFGLAKRLEYGLRLVKERAGVDEFVITEAAVRDMESFISDLIKRYYRQGLHPESSFR